MKLIALFLILLTVSADAGGRRARHINPAHAGATVALDSRFMTGFADGDAISTWTGRAGTTNDATAASTARPTYQVAEINGQPMLQFDGSNDIMTVTITVTNPCTILSVQYLSADTPINFRLGFAAGANVLALGYANTGVLYFFSSTGITVARARPTTLEILTGTANGASSSLTANGAVTTGSVANFSASNLTMHNNGSSAWTAGFGSRLEYYPAALSTSLRRRMEHAAAYSFKVPCN
jgi:hypothetical protein